MHIVMVTTSSSYDLVIDENQRRIFEAHKLVLEEVDAVSQKELRQELQAIRNKGPGKFPWIFKKVDESYEYVGDFEEVEAMNENNDTPQEELVKSGQLNIDLAFEGCDRN
eukprot:maker-scaffold_44-snap-gene-1.92-mRNA-1 protein AED:0.05 eAED:0.05 QI:365/0/0.5/1/0/0/2/0/109